MALQETFAKRGNWLFKHCGFLPFIILIPELAWHIYLCRKRGWVNCWWLSLIFMSVGFIGLGIRIFTVEFVPKGTSGRNTTEGQIAEQINTLGIHSIARHPLYHKYFKCK